MEPIYAPDTHNPDQGWIVTVVYEFSQAKFGCLTSVAWTRNLFADWITQRCSHGFPRHLEGVKFVIVQLVSGQLERNFVF